MDRHRNRLKQLDMMGALGAAVLGAGVALLFSEWLLPFAVPAALVGIAAHGWSMYAKHQLERQSNIFQALWETVAFRVCWLLLVALIAYVSVQIVLNVSSPKKLVAFHNSA